jgi:serine phosphatase RsbU (regulator of sigma subunit)
MMNKWLIFCTLLFFSLSSFAQFQKKIDSIKFVLSKADYAKDTNRVHSLGKLAELYINNISFDSGFYYAQATLKLAKELNFDRGIAKGYEEIGRAYSLQSNYVQTIHFSFEALRIYEKLKDQKMTADVLAAIAFNYKLQENYAQALEYMGKALVSANYVDDLGQQRAFFTQTADIYLRMKQFDSALVYAKRALEINKKLNDSMNKATLLNVLGTINRNKGDIEASILLHKEALQIYEERSKINLSKMPSAITQYNLALAYEAQKEWAIAQKYAEEALEVAKKLKIKEIIRNISGVLYRVTKEQGNIKMALEYLELNAITKDSLLSVEKAKAIGSLKNTYEVEKQQQEIALLNKDKQIQSVYNRALVIGVALMLALFLLSLFGYTQKKKANRLLQQKNLEIEASKTEIFLQNEALQQKQEEILAQSNFIEHKNKELEIKNFQIESNIKAAQNIHSAMFISETEIKAILGDYFVINKPKDVVSGDFYYVFAKENLTLIAIADCLGHGVQGAFMSLIGYGILDRLVRIQGMKEPAEILDALDKEIRFFFDKSLNYRASTMDFAIVTVAPLDDKNKKICFAGAKRNLVYANPSAGIAFKEMSGTRRAIGGTIRKDNPFITKEIELPFNTILYLNTDGYADQNNSNRMKFGKQNYTSLIEEIAFLPLAEQKQILESKLAQFTEGTQQRDDILLLGFRI